MTDLSTTVALVCASTAPALPLPELLPLLLEGLDLPADISRCLHIASEMPGLATIAALRISESTLRFLVSSFATASTRCHHGTNFHWRGLTARVHRRSHVLIYTCTQHCRGLWSALTQVLFQSSFLSLFQTSSRESFTRVVSQRSHVHLPHQLLPSQPLVLKAVRGCPLELKHV